MMQSRQAVHISPVFNLYEKLGQRIDKLLLPVLKDVLHVTMVDARKCVWL